MSISKKSFLTICHYMLGQDGYKKYKTVEIAIRKPVATNKINRFDDELAALDVERDELKNFPWNTDPSRYRIGTRGVAILRTGFHTYTISYHHIGNPAKRYVALRPDTPGAKVKVWRTDAKNHLYEDVGVALNQHAGGGVTTGSEGCQTTPKQIYPAFITFIGRSEGIQVPLGVQKKAETRFMNGVGKIPYLLLTQDQFDYILGLDPDDYGRAADLKYRMANFVNLPTIQKVVPELQPAYQKEDIIAELTEDPDLDTPDETDLAEAEQIPEPGTGQAVGGDNLNLKIDGDNVELNKTSGQELTPPEDKTIKAPAPSNMLSKAWKTLLGLGLIPTSGAGIFAAVRNGMTDGTFNVKDVFEVCKEVLLFMLPYLFWIGMAFLVFWGIKELLKQVSFIVTQWTTARTDMHNVKVIPTEAPVQAPSAVGKLLQPLTGLFASKV